MATKEDLHKLKFGVMVAPVSSTLSSILTDVGTVGCIDTEGYESNMFVLTFGVGGGSNTNIRLFDNDTSAATVGTVVTGRDVIFAVADNTAAILGTGTLANNTYPAVGTWVQSTGTLLPAAVAGKCFLFAYTGSKRYVKMYCSAGDSAVWSLHSVQGHFRYQGRGGLYVEPYLGVA